MDAQTPTNGVCPVVKTPFCRLPCGENAFKVQDTDEKTSDRRTLNEAKHVTLLPLQQVLQHAFQVRERQF